MKPTLLISKFDGIKIIQVDESILTTSNSKQESTKIGFAKKGNGKTKTVDLGKGAEKHKLKFFVFDRDENDVIFNTLRKKRYVEIIDKFKGKIKVFIDDYRIVDSDKHINKTVYELNCTVQDVVKVPTVNTKAQLNNEIKSMTADLSKRVNNLVGDGVISSVNTIYDAVANTESFIDSTMSTIEDGIMKVLDVQSSLLNAYENINSRIDRARRLLLTMKHILEFPQDFINLIIEATDEQNKQYSEIFEVTVENKKLSEISTDELSQIQYEELMKVEKAQQLNNLVAVVMELKQALNTSFASQQDFEAHIERIIKRLEYAGYTNEEIIRKQQIVKSYANTQKYRNIIVIEVKQETPLVEIVYARYGNLDNYDEVLKLNNLKDNDIVYGEIKVYDESNN